MDFKTFIERKLTDMALAFPNVQIIYGYEEWAETHLVELTPRSEYYNNVNLDDQWMNIVNEAINIFPDELLTFVSDDSSLKISKPIFVFNRRKPINHGVVENTFNQVEMLTAQMNKWAFIHYENILKNLKLELEGFQAGLLEHSYQISNPARSKLFLHPSYFIYTFQVSTASVVKRAEYRIIDTAGAWSHLHPKTLDETMETLDENIESLAA